MRGRRTGRIPRAAAALAVAVMAFAGGCTSSAHHAAPSPTGSASGAGRSTSDSSATWVVAENKRPGTSAWQLGDQGPTHAIEGYADHTGVLPGEPFRLFVSTTAPRWRVSAFRIGYYGGKRGRLVWTSAWQHAQAQPAATIEPRTRTVRAPWRPSLTVRTDGWPAGAYLLKLDSSQGYHRYVPLTVRSRTIAGRVVVVSEDLTWEAYNQWGGRSLYLGPGGYGDRSFAVSFDRPYDLTGAVKFLSFERPLIIQAEMLGLPLAYVTDIDVSNDPGLLKGARAVLSLGHDEYWTAAERRSVLAARDSGANLAFFGANAAYWQVRLESSPLGAERQVVCYKTDVGRDPYFHSHPQLRTERWRDLPTPEPESRVTGMLYECFPALGAYEVTTPGFFGFAGTGARRGSRYPGLVTPEIDRVYPGRDTPRPIQVVAHSPASCRGVTTYSDSTYYVASSGAGVFSVGTMRWVGVLVGYGKEKGVDASTEKFVRTVTDNILRAFARGPAGRVHPAIDNLAAVHPAPTNTTGAA